MNLIHLHWMRCLCKGFGLSNNSHMFVLMGLSHFTGSHTWHLINLSLDYS